MRAVPRLMGSGLWECSVLMDVGVEGVMGRVGAGEDSWCMDREVDGFEQLFGWWRNGSASMFLLVVGM